MKHSSVILPEFDFHLSASVDRVHFPVLFVEPDEMSKHTHARAHARTHARTHTHTLVKYIYKKTEEDTGVLICAPCIVNLHHAAITVTMATVSLDTEELWLSG